MVGPRRGRQFFFFAPEGKCSIILGTRLFRFLFGTFIITMIDVTTVIETNRTSQAVNSGRVGEH